MINKHTCRVKKQGVTFTPCSLGVTVSKTITICNKCPYSKCNNGLVWCSCDSFQIQEDIFNLVAEFDSITPPLDCPYRLEHVVLTG